MLSMSFAGEVMRDNTVVHAANRAAFLLALRDNGVLSVAELARITGLSRPTTQATLHELERENRVFQVKIPTRGAKQLGRPGRRYCFNASVAHVVGLDVGPHRLRGAVADLAGTILLAQTVEVSSRDCGGEIIEQVAGFLVSLVDGAGLSWEQVQTVVIASTGIVSTDGQVILSNAIPEWTGMNLAHELRAAIATDILLENDINMAALAESRLGVAQECDNAVFVHIGNRMNAAFILHGQVYRGATFSAGEVADIKGSPWDNADEPEAWTHVGNLVGSGASLDDAQVREELRVFARRIAMPLAIVSSAFDPDLVVIGGTFSRAEEAVVDMLREEVAVLVPRRKDAVIETSAMGTSGAVLGALVRAFEIVDEDNFGSARVPVSAHTWAATLRELDC